CVEGILLGSFPCMGIQASGHFGFGGDRSVTDGSLSQKPRVSRLGRIPWIPRGFCVAKLGRKPPDLCDEFRDKGPKHQLQPMCPLGVPSMALHDTTVGSTPRSFVRRLTDAARLVERVE